MINGAGLTGAVGTDHERPVPVQVNDSGLTYSPELMRIMSEISDMKKQS